VLSYLLNYKTSAYYIAPLAIFTGRHALFQVIVADFENLFIDALLQKNIDKYN
jgi:hypothetical protein